MLGNFHTVRGDEIVGIFNRTYSRLDMTYLECELESQSALGWSGSGLVSLFGGYFSNEYLYSASVADLDGDGRKDIVALVGDDLAWSELTFYRNNGTGAFDHFATGQGTLLMANRFPYNADTLFSSPQIGDITGDGRAEIALLAQPNGGPRIVQFYEMTSSASDTVFVLHPEWSTGLPESLETIRLADIDGDGNCELFGTTASSDTSAHWVAYFFRNSVWTRADILPAFSAADISFADANGDGHLDLFTSSEVWLSLNPSGINRGAAPHFSTFELSASPNPFNPSTEITFSVPSAQRVVIKVFNLRGQQVSVLQDGILTAGTHRVLFDGSHFPAGIYFLRLETGTHQRTLKLVLLK
jgi:hypothetical protein